MIDTSRATQIQTTLDRFLTDEIAAMAQCDRELVQQTFEQELNALSADARITQFLGVLAIRRVKLVLLKH